MSSTKKKRSGTPILHTKQSNQNKFAAFGELVVDGALPRVNVKVTLSKVKGKNKPTDHLVVELQCEV